MAGEFEKRTDNGQVIWTCTACREEIVNVSKPRGHLCQQAGGDAHLGPTGTPNSRRAPGTPVGFPPPGYQGAPNQAQQYPFEQFMIYQREQMQVFQTQQTQWMQKQQELMMRQQQVQEEQNLTNINRMMEMMKIQKSNETKVKCPKWEQEENVKNFLSRLESWNEIEKGKGKYLQLLEGLQLSWLYS